MFFQDWKEEIVLNPIKSVSHVYLNDHSLVTMGISRMDGILDQNKIIHYMVLPTNPPWLLKIIPNRKSLIREAMTLEIILYDLLHKDIGLKKEKEEGLISLGMNAKKEVFMLPPIFSNFFT